MKFIIKTGLILTIIFILVKIFFSRISFINTALNTFIGAYLVSFSVVIMNHLFIKYLPLPKNIIKELILKYSIMVLLGIIIWNLYFHDQFKQDFFPLDLIPPLVIGLLIYVLDYLIVKFISLSKKNIFFLVFLNMVFVCILIFTILKNTNNQLETLSGLLEYRNVTRDYNHYDGYKWITIVPYFGWWIYGTTAILVDKSKKWHSVFILLPIVLFGLILWYQMNFLPTPEFHG